MTMKKKRRLGGVCNSDGYHISSESDIDVIGFDDANPAGADMEVNHHVEEEECLEDQEGKATTTTK